MNDREHRAPRVLLATDGSIAARAAESWVTRSGWAERPVVAMGCRGRSDPEAVLLGSVTQQIIEHSPSPVLIARSTGMPPGRLPQRLLVVVESSLMARATVGWLSAHGWLRESRVTLLGLLGITPGLTVHGEPLAEELASEIRLYARDTLGGLVDHVRHEAADVSLELRFGHPLQVSLELADELEVDLVAVSRPDRRPGQYPFAEKLTRYAFRSVLFVPVT